MYVLRIFIHFTEDLFASVRAGYYNSIHNKILTKQESSFPSGFLFLDQWAIRPFYSNSKFNTERSDVDEGNGLFLSIIKQKNMIN